MKIYKINYNFNNLVCCPLLKEMDSFFYFGKTKAEVVLNSFLIEHTTICFYEVELYAYNSKF